MCLKRLKCFSKRYICLPPSFSYTEAVKQDDGTYRLTGTKIFISCGEHDWTENIVHIVLARTPDAPKGTKGISLFLVPKHVIKPDGESNGWCEVLWVPSW